MMTLVILFLGVLDESPLNEETIEGGITSEAESAQNEASLTFILHQNIDPYVENDNEYDASAYRVVQEYFSGSDFRMNGEVYPIDEVEEDLNSFFNAQLFSGNQQLGHIVAHQNTRGIINITTEDDYIEARKGLENNDDVRWDDALRREIPLADEKATVTYWVGRI